MDLDIVSISELIKMTSSSCYVEGLKETQQQDITRAQNYWDNFLERMKE